MDSDPKRRLGCLNSQWSDWNFFDKQSVISDPMAAELGDEYV